VGVDAGDSSFGLWDGKGDVEDAVSGVALGAKLGSGVGDGNGVVVAEGVAVAGGGMGGRLLARYENHKEPSATRTAAIEVERIQQFIRCPALPISF
jgi:fructose-1,6-bisphosphatase/sedoheptulose 1,7-bisphosphatase-like protein